MRQTLKTIILGCVLLTACSAGVNAQRKSEAMPQPNVLADMMLKEKKVRVIDDAPYIAYLVDSLGYTLKIDSAEMRRYGIYYQEMVKRGRIAKVFTKLLNRNSSIQVELSSQDRDDGKLLRSIKIRPTDRTMIWWTVVKLKEYGLKQTEGDGAFIDLKGKGLFAGSGSESIIIGCWFDKQ